jgi:hypothetical protein
MVLATATATGQPSARVVLCKDFDAELGRVSFVTNYDSRKGREHRRERSRRAGVPLGTRASPDTRRRGGVKAPDAESDAYFRNRATGKRASAPGRARRASRCDHASNSMPRFARPRCVSAARARRSENIDEAQTRQFRDRPSGEAITSGHDAVELCGSKGASRIHGSGRAGRVP